MFTNEEILKGVRRLGIHLSDGELETLQSGKMVSLEARGLSEIGSVFILAAALGSINSEKPYKAPIFRDICGSEPPWNYAKGIPVYCWHGESSNRCCLYLFLKDGIPSCQIARTVIQSPA